MCDKTPFLYQILKAVYQGWNQDSNLGEVKVICSKNFKNWNINTRGWQQCIISINFLIICIFYFEKKNHKSQYIIKSL